MSALTPIGLDLSLVSTGWAVYGGEVGRIRPKKLSGTERRRWIADQVVETWFAEYGRSGTPVVYVIESVPTHGAHSVVPLGMLHGVVLNALDGKADGIAYVPGPVLKKHLTGKGNAKKEQMVEAAQALGYKGKSHDEADAFGLALLGHHLLGGTDHLTPMRSACLAGVTWEIAPTAVTVREVQS